MGGKETIRRGYDALAEAYAERCSDDERERTVLQEFLGSLPKPTRILDAGCGQETPVLHRLSQKLGLFETNGGTSAVPYRRRSSIALSPPPSTFVCGPKSLKQSLASYPEESAPDSLKHLRSSSIVNEYGSGYSTTRSSNDFPMPGAWGASPA